MPIKENREYRAAGLFKCVQRAEGSEESYVVEGYATTFEEPYLMYEYEDGLKCYERVDRKALDGADLSDVIFQYDHSGMVYARIRNMTLQLTIDDHGLFVRADLGKTQASRDMYEAINTGLVCEMSFCFTIKEEAYERDHENHTRTRVITRIGKVYDVSAVSIPANPGTEIAARSLWDGVIQRELEEVQELEKRNYKKKLIKLLTEV